MLHCAITKQVVQGAGDAIWDDGEWISWDWINRQLGVYGPDGDFADDLVVLGERFFKLTGRRLKLAAAVKALQEQGREDSERLTPNHRSEADRKAYIEYQLKDEWSADMLVHHMLDLAKGFRQDQDEELPIFGDLGELYAAMRFGIELHKDPYAQGSDGRLGNMLVEVKTITPLRSSRHVTVKKSGNFGALAIVKIDGDFRIDAKLIKRKRLPEPAGTKIRVLWDDFTSDDGSIATDEAALR